jgi:hypothetical protein
MNNQGVDTNPCTRSEIKLYKETLSLSKLDPDELDIFKAQFATLLTMPGSDERRIMLDRLEAYIIALRCIKHELDDKKFTGLNPEDTEIGFGLIRPQFTRAAAAYKYQWTIALTTAWADWLYETAGNAYTVGKDFGLCITHLKSLVTPTPFMAECRFQVGRTGILIPNDVRALMVGDTENGVSVVSVPTMILKPKASLYGRAKSDHIGTDEVALGGLVIGLGRALKEESPATWTA